MIGAFFFLNFGFLIVLSLSSVRAESDPKASQPAASIWPQIGYRSVTSVKTSDRLVLSTLTSLSAIPLIGGSVHAPSFPGTLLLEEEDYLIDKFSVSFKENLVLYGKNTILARPLFPGPNYLYIDGPKTLGIDFEGDFTVDWLDKNVYAFKDASLKLFSLAVPEYSAVIYNRSAKVRNLVVDYKEHFISWIANENNLMKAQKDGNGAFTLWTEKRAPIHCMTVSPLNSRFYFITTSLTTVQKRVYDENAGKYIWKYTTSYWMNLYSLDYGGKYTPIKEASFAMRSSANRAVQMAKHGRTLYLLVREDDPRKLAASAEESESGHLSPRTNYALYKMEAGKMELLYNSANWPLTSLQVAWYNPGSSRLCLEKACPQICLHTGRESVRCLCQDNADNCTATHPLPTAPNSANTATDSGASRSSGHYPTSAPSLIDTGKPEEGVFTPGSPVASQVGVATPPSSYLHMAGVGVLAVLFLVLVFFGWKRCCTRKKDDLGDAGLDLSQMGTGTAMMFNVSKPAEMTPSTPSKGDASTGEAPPAGESAVAGEEATSWCQLILKCLKMVLWLLSCGILCQGTPPPEGVEQPEEGGETAPEEAEETETATSFQADQKKKKKKHKTKHKKHNQEAEETSSGMSSTSHSKDKKKKKIKKLDKNDDETTDGGHKNKKKTKKKRKHDKERETPTSERKDKSKSQSTQSERSPKTPKSKSKTPETPKSKSKTPKKSKSKSPKSSKSKSKVSSKKSKSKSKSPRTKSKDKGLHSELVLNMGESVRSPSTAKSKGKKRKKKKSKTPKLEEIITSDMVEKSKGSKSKGKKRGKKKSKESKA